MPAEPAHQDGSEYPSGPLIYEIARGRQRDQLAQRQAYRPRSGSCLNQLPRFRCHLPGLGNVTPRRPCHP